MTQPMTVEEAIVACDALVGRLRHYDPKLIPVVDGIAALIRSLAQRAEVGEAIEKLRGNAIEIDEDGDLSVNIDDRWLLFLADDLARALRLAIEEIESKHGKRG